MYDRRPDYSRRTQARRPVRRGGRPAAVRRTSHSRAYARKLAMRRRRRRLLAVCVLVVLILATVLMIGGLHRRAPSKVIVEEPQAYIAAPPLSDEMAEMLMEELTDIPTEAPVAVVVEEPTVMPTEAVAEVYTPAPAEVPLVPTPLQENTPDNAAWKLRYGVYTDGDAVKNYIRDGETAFPEDGSYSTIEGVTTFRGGNLRQNAAYGTAALKEKRFKALWKNTIGAIDSGYTEWTGVGWTGQPAMVRWPAQLRAVMNLKPEYRSRDDLIEVIYATLDGNIYFLDAETGEYTREPIHLGFPIKGSVSVDPRGYPLLYVGQGISKADGVTGKIGWRVYSLLDQRELFFLDGHDKLCYRDHGAFDGSCLVDAATDTVLQGGENGIFYSVKLNTEFDISVPYVSVSPEVTAYRYKSAISSELGIENSVAALGQYAWFADNSGLLTCMDLNHMEPVWLMDVGDDTDSTIALEREADGRLALYTVNQVDKQGEAGICTLCKVDAMTGLPDWFFTVQCESDGTNGGGGFASPAVGAGAYADYVYFNICRTDKGGGMVYCFNKADGRVVWSQTTGNASWSSPVLVYRPDGTGVLIVANVNGRGVLRMYDPATGKKLDKIELEGKIEGSPAVFGDLLVVGTRERRIYGVRLR